LLRTTPEKQKSTRRSEPAIKVGVVAAGSLLSKFMIIALPSILRATAEKKSITAADSIRLGSAEKKKYLSKRMISKIHEIVR